jgi:hypothetical protein
MPQDQAAAASSQTPQDPKDAHIASLQQQGTALQQQFHQLQLEHAALQRKAALAESKPLRPKIHPPRSFTGDSNAAARVDDFLSELERQFDYYGAAAFPDGAAKVSFSVMCMQDKAAKWWTAHTSELASHGLSINTWEAFVEAMRARFRPIEAATLARSALDSLRQTGGLHAYVEIFQSKMMLIPDMAIADQLHAFTRGLKDTIRTEVLKARPKSVSEAINKATQAEAYLGYHAKSGGFGRFQNHYGRSGGYHGAGAGASGGATAMEVSNINMEQLDGWESSAEAEPQLLAKIRELEQVQQQQQQFIASMFQRGGGNKGNSGGSSSSSRGPLVPNVSKADFERCRRENRCLNCKERGSHIARDCKKPFSTNW